MYRLSEKYGEAELEAEIEEWRKSPLDRIPVGFLYWLQGAAMGFLVAWVLL